MEKKYHKKLGKLGEKIALQYLKKLDYQILHQNFHIQGGEIDLITKYQKQIIFFEIKTRRIYQSKTSFSNNLSSVSAPNLFLLDSACANLKFGLAEEQISWHQKIALLRTARTFLHLQNLTHYPWQFDLISINLELSSNLLPRAKIFHLKNIFAE